MVRYQPLFKPVARNGAVWTGSVIVLAPGDIPTTDFYVSPRLGGLSPDRVLRFDSRRLDAGAEHLPAGSFVIIVRHASAAWLGLLERSREKWSGVAFLMDDDLPGAWRCGDVPLDYGLWTTGRYLRARRGLARVCDRIWMSTEALRQRFPYVPSTLVVPLAFDTRPTGAAPEGVRRWGYHGTRVHGRELRWLVPVVESVQKAVPKAEFEVFGDRSVERLFAHVPRVRVLTPCSWPGYVAHCHASNLAVGVAPMLPGRFNALRSHTKIFDIARCGAVGLFSDRPPYSEALAGSGAVLLPDDRERWAVEITRLLENDDLRLSRYRQLQSWVIGRGDGMGMADLIGESAPQ